MLEAKFLAAIVQDRNHLDVIGDHDVSGSLSDKGKLIFEEIKEYYAHDSNTPSVDLEVLGNRLARKYPKHAEILRAVLGQFSEPVSGINVLIEVVELEKEAIKEKLIAALAGGKEAHVNSLIKKWQELAVPVGEQGASVYNGLSLDELLTTTEGAGRLLLEPVSLANQLHGGPLRGHNTIIFARPDVGKTAAAITVAASALKQEKRVLYCGNEDPAEMTIERLIANLTDIPLSKLPTNPSRIMERAKSLGYDNFYFVELYPGSVAEIEKHVKQLEPDVLIVDQMRNLRDQDTNRVIQLDSVARGLRNIGKKYKLYNFSLTQAGDSASNKLYLEMGDCDFSNTGVPGAADCMIGIGATREYLESGHRMLSFPKNKIGGPDGKDPIRVTIDIQKSKLI